MPNAAGWQWNRYPMQFLILPRYQPHLRLKCPDQTHHPFRKQNQPPVLSRWQRHLHHQNRMLNQHHLPPLRRYHSLSPFQRQCRPPKQSRHQPQRRYLTQRPSQRRCLPPMRLRHQPQTLCLTRYQQHPLWMPL